MFNSVSLVKDIDTNDNEKNGCLYEVKNSVINGPLDML